MSFPIFVFRVRKLYSLLNMAHQMFVSITSFLDWKPNIFIGPLCSIWCWNSACQLLSPYLKWISVYVYVSRCVYVCVQMCMCAAKLTCVSEKMRLSIMHLWACVCVSSWVHCEGVIVEPRPCKLSDSERCCTSKGHAFWAFPVYYKPCNTHQGCCSAPPCPSSSYREKPPF